MSDSTMIMEEPECMALLERIVERLHTKKSYPYTKAFVEPFLRTVMIPFEVSRRELVWGMNNETWDADIQEWDPSEEGTDIRPRMAKDDESCLHSEVPSNCQNANLIADNIYWLTEEWHKRFRAKINHGSLQELREDADLAFWAVVADAFPEITSGDFSIGLTFDMHRHMEHWIEHWLNSNHHPAPSRYRWVQNPADDELCCDECGADVLKTGCWVADIPGYGAAGVRVLCPLDHEHEDLEDDL